MATNTFSFDPQKGEVSAVSMIHATREYECACGARFSFAIDWPENMEVKGAVNVNGVICPTCSAAVELPMGIHWVEDFRLKSKPV